jgi:hypothetical protein
MATRTGGNSELLANAGILIKASSEKLKKALELLIADIKLRKKYFKLEKERALKYDWNSITNIYQNLVLNKVKGTSDANIP